MLDHPREGQVPRRSGDQPPAVYVIEGTFPDVRLRDDAPVSAHFAVAFAKALKAAVEASTGSLRSIAKDAGVTHPTVTRILDGQTLPDLRSISGLEVALRTSLYPAELHRQFSETHSGADEASGEAEQSH
ncbi:helix-turn-helix transcriptional regulator [Lentzea sp. NPDC034063]|uniref:helix-turn-helix domain-containing protein n=1 Tax=unclassified Lentzea TaxID=2643253 RepID=UPI0033D3A790